MTMSIIVRDVITKHLVQENPAVRPINCYYTVGHDALICNYAGISAFGDSKNLTRAIKATCSDVQEVDYYVVWAAEHNGQLRLTVTVYFGRCKFKLWLVLGTLMLGAATYFVSATRSSLSLLCPEWKC